MENAKLVTIGLAVVVLAAIAVISWPHSTPYANGATPTPEPEIPQFDGHAYNIAIRYATFEPANIHVPPRAIISIKNEDGTIYQLAVTGPDSFTSEQFGGGATYNVTLAKPGLYVVKESRYGFTTNIYVI